jgi:DMSO reductase family type II enzyme chaperone
MFVYSLAGLSLDADAAADVEIEDNETTARSGVYQVLGRLLSLPDAESHATAQAGGCPEALVNAAELLAYDFDFGSCTLAADVTAEDHQAEYLRLFEVGSGDQGPPASLLGGVYSSADRMRSLEEVVRFYEYFGLRTSPEDPRPADHLSTELEFLQYLTFKEAASSSPRLQASFSRAQQDFLDRQLTTWLPQLVEKVEAQDPSPFWLWAVQTASNFAAADAEYVQAKAG